MPRRMYLTVWYDDFRTKSSGDVFASEGQWYAACRPGPPRGDLTNGPSGLSGATTMRRYFLVNKQRFPTKVRPLRCSCRRWPVSSDPSASMYARFLHACTYQGTFLLSKNEPFEFSDRNKPLLYSAMINHTKAPFKLHIKVSGPVDAPPATTYVL